MIEVSVETCLVNLKKKRFSSSFQQKVAKSMGYCEKPPKLATFRVNYHVLELKGSGWPANIKILCLHVLIQENFFFTVASISSVGWVSD